MVLTDRLPPWLSTRTAAVLVALAVVVAGAGAYVAFTDEREPLDAVPAGADAVVHVDAGALAANGTVLNVSRSAFRFQTANRYYRGPHVDEEIAPFVESDAVDLGAASDLTMFAALTENHTADPNYTATVVRADWSVEAVVDAVEAYHGVELRETTAAGHALYVPESSDEPVVGVLGDGQYAVGARAAVMDAIAVADGEAPPVGGELRSFFESARDGYVTFAYPFPKQAIPDVPFVNTTAFDTVGLTSGVYYRNETANGTKLGVRLRVQTDGEVAARDVANTLGLAVSFYAQRSGDERLVEAAARVRTSHPGSVAVLSYESRPEQISALLEALKS